MRNDVRVISSQRSRERIGVRGIADARSGDQTPDARIE